MSSGRGAIGVSSGSIPNRSRHSTRSSAFDVRELVSAAIVRTSPIGLVREQRHRSHRPFGHDRHVRDRTIRRAAQILDAGDHPDVDRPLVEQRGTLGRRIELHGELRTQLQTVDERPRVQVVNRTQPDRSHPRRSVAGSGQPVRIARPARLVAVQPRWMLPRISSSAVRLGPRAPGSDCRHAVDVVGADEQADLRQLRTVERPVDLDRRHVAAAAGPAPRTSRRHTRSSVRSPRGVAAAGRTPESPRLRG